MRADDHLRDIIIDKCPLDIAITLGNDIPSFEFNRIPLSFKNCKLIADYLLRIKSIDML
jgi:hypothetical protein